MSISLDKYFSLHSKAIQIRNDRTEILAGNLANADTPGYKAKDLDFQKAMKNVNYTREYNLMRTDSKHMDVSLKKSDEIKFRDSLQPDTGDGNTVDVQIERNQFLENAMRYQASLQFLSGKIQGMKKALSGGQSR